MASQPRSFDECKTLMQTQAAPHADLSHELSQLDLSEGDASVGSGSDECWKGRLEVTEHIDDKRVLRVSHHTARALPWQVVFQAKVIGKHFKVNCACMLATMPLLGDLQLVLYPGCKLFSALVGAEGACTVVDIRKDDASVQSAESDTVVKVTLGSATIISVFPSDKILKQMRIGADRTKWFTDRGYNQGLARDFAKACADQMDGLWRKATGIMKMAQGGVRPFVKHVMRKLQQNVVDGLKASGKSWDCSFGPEKFDAGPEEIEVTNITTSGVFMCNRAHEFQVTESDPPTALEVVSPSADLVAAGFFDGQIIYVDPSETRALDKIILNSSQTYFKCRKSASTYPVGPLAKEFLCIVQSVPPVSIVVMASVQDPIIQTAVSSAGPVRLWMVQKNKKKKGYYVRDTHKLSADSFLIFEDTGSGLPVNIVAGRRYQPTCIRPASFELMPELIVLSADFDSEVQPLKLRRCETAQRLLHRRAMMSHEKIDSAKVQWSGIRAQKLNSHINDFAKMFCSTSDPNVDIFETNMKGELLFNIITYCKAFHTRCCSFSLQHYSEYWHHTSSLLLLITQPWKLKELSRECSSARNSLFHGDMELTYSDFNSVCTLFEGILEEVIRVSKLLSSCAAFDAEISDVVKEVEQTLVDMRNRRLSKAPASHQDMEKAVRLEHDVKNLQVLVAEQQEQLEGPPSHSDNRDDTVTIPNDCKVLGRILRDLGALHLLQNFTDIHDDDSNLDEFSRLKPVKLFRVYDMPEATAIAFIERCRNASDGLSGTPSFHDAVERALWLKACLILEACAKGVKPFVGKVMERLHKQVIENVKSDVMCDLGACEDEDWDCSCCDDADELNFTENAPVALTICTIDSNGVIDCGVAHELKSHALKPCRLRNIPANFFPDFNGVEVSPALPLLICANPASIGNPQSSTFLLLHCSQPTPTAKHLTPFLVTRFEPPGDPFRAVLCYSRPGHTAQLVKSSLLQQNISVNAQAESPDFAFGFWSLQSDFKNFKHDLKDGHILRFDSHVGNILPPGIKPGSRYLVTDAQTYSFNICGPILAPLTAESYSADDAHLVVIRRSPIGRLRDAARLFHSRKLEVHWSGIKARDLSSHHGEFCKLFCSQTSRQVDFFSDSGTQSGEQLLNMISMCTAFSVDSNNQILQIDVQKSSLSKPFRCIVHSSPRVDLFVVASSNNPSDPSASKPAKAHSIKLWTGSMNEAGIWKCDVRKLQADNLVSFSDAGFGLPLNIHAGCRYQPTRIGTGSFELLRPNFCSLFDVDYNSFNDLKSALDKAKKGAAGQPISKDLKDLFNIDPSNHTALKLALEGIQKGPFDCEISKYLRNLVCVDLEKHDALKIAIGDLKNALVEKQELIEPGVIHFRHKLAHDLLTLETRHFEALVACARTLFAGVHRAIPFVSDNGEALLCAEQSIAEIERIIERHSSFSSLESTLTDHERDVVKREHERLCEEHDRLKQKLIRKFDSFRPCLKKDIQDQLVESNQIGASGGQGKVYRVKHWLWGETLAVKVFHETAEGRTWLRELNSLTFLTHANIVRMLYIVYETLDDRSQCRAPLGYAMELMAISAADRHDFHLDQLLDVFVQIARALAFSHENGVVHFDVKPENILLDESCSVAKLCDFGCAHKLKSESASESVFQGQKRGTDRYMAPEVLLGKAGYDPKLCDIYSFGKTMWKLLHPTQDVEINVVSSVDARVPSSLKELIEQCLIRDPAKRPQNMSEVLMRLDSVSTGEGMGVSGGLGGGSASQSSITGAAEVEHEGGGGGVLWWTRRAAGTAGCLAAQAGDDLTEEIDRSEEAEATETVEAVDRADDATLKYPSAGV